MRLLSRAIIAALLIPAFPTTWLRAQELPDTAAMISAARVTADSVLVLLDGELWDETWAMFAPAFRNQVTSAQLAMGSARPAPDSARLSLAHSTRRSIRRPCPGRCRAST